MEPLSRLDSISPELSELFRQGSEMQRLSAVSAACEKVVQGTGLAGPEIDIALASIKSGGIAPEGLAGELSALSEGFDDRYFELSDEDQDDPLLPGALPFFQKARAASSLAFVVSSDNGALVEALYEAIAAIENRQDVLGLVGAILSKAR